VQLTHTAQEVAGALDALRSDGIDTLVVVGGDGSVAGTLGTLIEQWPEAAWPRVLLAPGGTVNTIAHSLGARGAADAIVRRLLETPQRCAISRRPLVRVRSAEGETRSGMIFANGCAVRWLRAYYDDSPRGVRGAASVVARIAASALVNGELAARIFEPVAAEIDVDGERLGFDHFSVIGAASVAHVGLGFRPFHTAGTDETRFHLTLTDAGPRQIVRELPALRTGRVTDGSCLTHISAAHVSLRCESPQPWSLDADIAPDTRSLELSATRPLAFLVS
jgi:diacylglycerol kinase family enzyme